MAEENKDQEFRLKNIDETRNHFIQEMKQNKLMSKKSKKVCIVLNHNLILASAVTGCISIPAFCSLIGIPIGIMRSVVRLKFCGITSGIVKHNSINKKKKRNMIK